MMQLLDLGVGADLIIGKRPRLEGPRRFVVVEHDRALSDALARAADRARRALDRERSRAALREAHSTPIGPGGRRLSGGARATAVAAD